MAWEPKDPTGRSGQDPFDEIFKKAQELFRRFMPTRGIGTIIVIVIAALVLFQAFFIVQPDEQGVVKRFGDVVRLVGPGPHIKIPLFESVVTPKVEKLHRVEIGFRIPSHRISPYFTNLLVIVRREFSSP